MKGSFFTFHSLTDQPICKAYFLIFITFFVLIPFCYGHAENYIASTPGIPTYSFYADSEKKLPIRLLLNYAHKQTPSWVQDVVNNIRDPAHWVQNELDLNDVGDNGNDHLLTERGSSLVKYGWIQFNARLLYGHNWLHPTGYLGGEMAATLGRASTLPGARPLGKITLGYINGNSTLLDNTHGFDIRGTLNFNQNFSLNAGTHQDENVSLGNYVVLRWKLIGD